MIDIRPWFVIPAFALLLSNEVSGAAEPNAVGIVMKVSGATDPDTPPSEEIAANTTIRLSPGAELTFLHYPPICELVTVAGGTLRVTKTAFTTDGEVKSQQTRPCPRVYELSGTGAAMLARDVLRLPTDPKFIFSGDRAGEVREAAVYEKGGEERLLFRFDLVDRRATPPEGAAAMVPAHRYVLRLTMSDAAQPVDYFFTAVTPSGAADELVVFHVD